MLSAFTLLTAFSSLTAAFPRDNTEILALRRDSNEYEEPRPHIHPLSDPSKLKYEIVGIVGAYLFWSIATVILIVVIRYRLRRQGQVAAAHLPPYTMMKTFQTRETVREIPSNIDTNGLKSPSSLLSPRLASLKSWTKKSNRNVASTVSLSSVQSHEQHKAQDLDDLSKLYAAVMVHDDAKSQGRSTAALSAVSIRDTTPLSPGYPPEFAHLHNANVISEPLKSPAYNAGFGQRLHHPMAPTPTTDTFAEHTTSHYNPNIHSRTSSRSTRTTPLSMISDTGSQAPMIASPRHKNFSIRSQNISPPIGSADMSTSHYYDDTAPLSPRIYTPGPPPPVPGKSRQAQVPVDPIYEDQTPNHYQQYQQSYPVYYEEKEYVPPVPSVPRYMSKSPGLPNSPVPSHLAQNTREKRVPPALSLRTQGDGNTQSQSPVSASAKKLPFRDMYGDSSLRSAPPTKTTFLERPTKISSGPKTGVPYSPYIPNTPMTPITPRRLLNKNELKLKRKGEKLKVLHEDDLVQDDEDMWGK